MLATTTPDYKQPIDLGTQIASGLQCRMSTQQRLWTAIKRLRESLEDAPRASTKGCTGITTFIKEELVADGVAKPVVRPPVPFAKNASNKGMRAGRCFDKAFQTAVDGNGHTAATTAAFALLRSHANVVPVACQHRVVMEANRLTTMLDAVGIDLRTLLPVCIELKTCQLPADVYNQYATTSCRRTPMLRCCPDAPNTERTRHYLQAAFGAECLRSQLNIADAVDAVVLVRCKDVCKVYRVPRSFHIATRFARLVRIPVTPAKARSNASRDPKPTKRPPQTSLAWTADASAALSNVGLKVAASSARSTKFKLLVRNTIVVGVAARVPTWSTMGFPARKATTQALVLFVRKAVRKQPSLVASNRITPMVVAHLTPGGRPQPILAGSPFTVRAV